MKHTAAVIVAVAGAFFATPASAKVAPTSLAELAKRAAVILVGQVAAVHELGGSRVAEVELLRVVKGYVETSRVFVFAQPTWTCDIADARKGETALFFLADGREMKQSRQFWRELDRARGSAPFFMIEWSGRGRMPVRMVDGIEFVTLWTADVWLPTEVSTVDGPEPEYAGFIRSARLDDVVTAVQASLQPQE